MSKYLDLDDVVAGNPEAERELAELRQYVTRLRETISEIDAYAENLAVNREFKPISIADDLWQILDRHYSTPESEPDGETAIEASGWEHEQLPTEQELCDSLSKYAPHTPEQTGDALAALEALIAEARKDSPGFPGHISAAAKAESILRRHLTASGVPHAPEELKRVPNELKRHMEACCRTNQDDKAQAFGVAIEIVQRAIASAPADANNANVTCECERGPREIVENTDEGGTKWWTLATHCTDCLESASAPTDGRE